MKIRYKAPDGDTSKLISQPLLVENMLEDINKTSDDFKFAAAVAWLGQHLRNSKHVGGDLDDLIQLAAGSKGEDPHGYRSEFLNLARTVNTMGAGNYGGGD